MTPLPLPLRSEEYTTVHTCLTFPQMDLHHGNQMNMNMNMNATSVDESMMMMGGEQPVEDNTPQAKMKLYHGPVNINPNQPQPTRPCQPCTINCNELDSKAFRQKSECDSTAVPGNP